MHASLYLYLFGFHSSFNSMQAYSFLIRAEVSKTCSVISTWQPTAEYFNIDVHQYVQNKGENRTCNNFVLKTFPNTSIGMEKKAKRGGINVLGCLCPRK